MLGASHLQRWMEEIPHARLFTGKQRSLLTYAVAIFLASISLTTGYLLFNQSGWFVRGYSGTTKHGDYYGKQTTISTHPIEDLIHEAHMIQVDLLKEQSHDVAAAAARYRKRRGRHPPPGFDAWASYAFKHDAIVVESFFDRIYADIAPFWGIEPHVTAERAASFEHSVNVRNGTVHTTGSTEGHVPWMQLWAGLVKEAAPFLPDVDMPINYMDESRITAPWEDVAAMVEKEQKSRAIPPVGETVKNYSGLSAMDAKMAENKRPDPEWHRGDYWELTRVACAPNSPSRNVEQLKTFEAPPEFPQDWRPEFSWEGYVRNYSASLDPCQQPHLRGLHGTFIEPLTIQTSKELIPMFGGCKLTTNNDILIPGAMYLTDDPMYSGGKSHGPPWADKSTRTVWRGVASGGRNKAENWAHFQRHRLVEMLNGTTVSRVEAAKSRAATFQMPSPKQYPIPRLKEGRVGEWLEGFADAGFTELLCFPKDECGYVQPHLSAVDKIPMEKQYGYKFMPDVDGNSFSARFRGFLLSTSLPIKASLYAEWHDDRLRPWLHFVPMDNTFLDLYGILDYFGGTAAGDRAAAFIASEGRSWGNKVLRREDMLLYVWRLLLEFARVCDERRDKLGYVDDLVQ
ncbi:glycosyltransferase family 90 protein [Xylariaceae sp. FL0594]|nr:glycosyltransferase family 90 protein [Xylariaceae sp. FL0594]